MEEDKREFPGILCGIYMTVILAAVPLYTGGTYDRIGDTKYLLFANVSLLCQGLWLLYLFLQFFRERSKERLRWSTVDLAMLSYALCVFLSAAFSSYGRTAWLGYRDWYMGAASQLLFVGIYFLASRCYDGRMYSVALGETALLAIAALGLMNRLDIDLLHLFEGFAKQDWEISHMLSTVGNINWLCGYLSMALIFPVTGYLESNAPVRKWTLYGISVTGLVLLCIQGSDSGPVLASALLLFCVFSGSRKRNHLIRGTALAAGTAIGISVMKDLIVLRQSMDLMPHDGNSRTILTWGGWRTTGICLLAICLVLVYLRSARFRMSGRISGNLQTRRNHKIRNHLQTTQSSPIHRNPKEYKKCMMAAAVIVVGLAALTAAAVWLGGGSLEDEWGTGRGALWKIAWEGFQEAPFIQKLIGAGPDCFAVYLDTRTVGTGHWAGAVFANAHNEWLNQLVNIGILGTGCYLGIFVTAGRRYARCLPGLCAVLLYLLHSLVSFQQVLNAPLLFLLLGLCESQCRRRGVIV